MDAVEPKAGTAGARGAEVRASLVAQEWSCRAIGSPLYGTVLDAVVADYEAGGISARLLTDVTDQPQHDALPLRYLACAHRLALTGGAPALARHYPSCGGSWDGSSDVADDFLATVAANEDEFRAGLLRNVQTNEVGRAPVLASGFARIARRHGLPVVQLEIGSSAGLLSNWDRYRYDTGATSAGDPASPLVFGSSWWSGTPPTLADVTVIARHASDVAPIDITTPEGRATSMSFVWPDQGVRFERLRAALDVAAEHPVAVERADAGQWLTSRLADAPTAGAATVVFHSIVWQYLPAATRDELRHALERAGRRADPTAPLLWLRMEPATREFADLRLTTWAGGDPVEEVLAEVGYHGADIRWLA